MTSSINSNRCKLLVLDLDTNNITVNDLRAYFTSYGPVEWIEIFPESTSAVIYFVSHLIVNRLVSYRTCLIGQNNVRLRRFRLDSTNWNIDCHTLYVKLTKPSYSNSGLSELSLRYCFRDYESYINKIDMIDNNQALISFSYYDHVDQILIAPANVFVIEGIPLVFERMMEKIEKQSRWDQPPTPAPLSTIPVLSARDPVVHKLVSHIEYLSKRLREQPTHSRDEINRLEAEVFILKNENAKLKSKQDLSLNKNLEQRLTALEDISNQIIKKQHHHSRRKRSNSNEKRSKRRRNYTINDD